MAIDPFADYCWSDEAAKILSTNSGHRISRDYVHRLASCGVLTAINVHGRNLFIKAEVERVRVEKRGARREGQSA